jgi:hypothetical protein
MRHRIPPIAAMRLGGRAQDRELALGLGRIGEKGGCQRASRGQFRQQQADALRLGEAGILEARLHQSQHLADAMFVYVGVLPQIEGGEVKAERIDSAAELLEPALGQDCRAVGGKRIVDDREIGEQLAAFSIGRRITDRRLRRFQIQSPRGRGEPCVDPRDRAPVRLVLSVGRAVGRARRMICQRIRYAH